MQLRKAFPSPGIAHDLNRGLCGKYCGDLKKIIDNVGCSEVLELEALEKELQISV